jgi:hypothetical protein
MMEQIFCEKNLEAIKENYAEICKLWKEYKKVEAAALGECEKKKNEAFDTFLRKVKKIIKKPKGDE